MKPRGEIDGKIAAAGVEPTTESQHALVNWAGRRDASSRCAVSGMLRRCYRVRVLRPCVRLAILKWEGGVEFSSTWRDILRTQYDVEVGPYSYGAPLKPGILPPGTRVGNYCSLAAGLLVMRRNHTMSRISMHPFFFNRSRGLLKEDSIEEVADNALEIGHDVWIGTSVMVTPGCRRIGTGAVVGAGAVVTRDVPPFGIVAGNPARLIRPRFEPAIQAILLESQWWEQPLWRLCLMLPLFLGAASLEAATRLRDRLREADASAPSMGEPTVRSTKASNRRMRPETASAANGES